MCRISSIDSIFHDVLLTPECCWGCFDGGSYCCSIMEGTPMEISEWIPQKMWFRTAWSKARKCMEIQQFCWVLMLDVNSGLLWLTNAYNASKNGYCTIENAMITPPKFNIAPEKWGLEDESHFGRPIFRINIKLGGYLISYHNEKKSAPCRTSFNGSKAAMRK